MIEVFLAKSLICFLGQCHPALVGRRTPVGTFPTQLVLLHSEVKDEKALIFAPDGTTRYFAVHVVPTARRASLLQARSTQPVTLGCVNVSPSVFKSLTECCSGQPISITR